MSVNSKVKSGNIDMLNAPIVSSLIKFALPLIASGVLQQSFVAVDVAVVGRFAGKEALAAVGSNSMVINLMLNLFMGIAVGANIVIANYIGRKDRKNASLSVSTAAITSIASGLIIAALGIIFSPPILRAMSTPDDVLPLAIIYLRIYFLGMPFLMVYNFGAAILRSIGDTRRPFYILIVSGVVNFILNLVLVIGFEMSVTGVAIATVIANAVNAGLMVRLLARETGECHVDWLHLCFSGANLGKMLRIGIPTGLQGMVFSFANIFIQSSVNSFGALAVAGSAAALNYEYYCYYIIAAFSQAVVAFVSSNYGAGNHIRCRRIVKRAMLLATVGSGVCNVAIAFAGNYAIIAFTDHADVIHFAVERLHYVLLFQWIACSYEITGASMRGLGNAMTPTLITIGGTCILRLAWVGFVVPAHHQFSVLMAVYPLSWILTGVAMIAAWWHLAARKLATAK